MRESSPPSFSEAMSDSQGADTKTKWTPKSLIRHAERSHSRIPGVRKIPFPALAIILFIAFINIAVWIAVAVVLVSYSRCHSEGHGTSRSMLGCSLIYVPALLSVCRPAQLGA